MAVNVSGAPLSFEATVDTDNFNAKIKDIERKIDGIGKNVGKGVFNEFARGATQLFAAEKIVSFFGDSIKEALDAEAATANFKNTLETIGRIDVFDRLTAQANKMAEQFQYLDNDDVTGVFTKLIDLGSLTEKQITDLLPVIVDFSAKTGKSLGEATDSIIKGLSTGASRELKKFGIELNSTGTQSENLAIIMTTLKGKVEGAADAFGETATGKIAATQQQFANLKEEVGNGLIPVLNKVLNLFNFLLKEINKIPQTAKDALADLRNIVAYGFDFANNQAELRDIIRKRQQAIKDVTNSVISAGESVLTSKDKTVLGFEDSDDDKKAPEKVKKDNSDLNALLNERKSILQSILDIQRGSKQSGLSEDATEIDRINEKYEKLLAQIDEYNKKATRLKRPTIETGEVNQARTIEINNAIFKREAADYISSLEAQKTAFTQFEEAKKQIGLQKAKELFGENTKGFTSYLQFLNSEAQKLAPKIAFGTANVGEIEKAKAILAAIKEARGEVAKDEQTAMLDLLSLTLSFNDKKAAIENRYQTQFATLSKLRGKITEEEYESRLKIIQASQGTELTEMKNSAIRQSDLYKKLGTDLIGYSSEQINTLINELESALTKGTFTDALGNILTISPELKKQLEDYIEQLRTAQGLSKNLKTASIFESVGTGLNDLAGKLGNINSALADTINVLGNISSSVSGAIKSLDAFKNAKTSGDKISAGFGIVGAAVGIISTVVGVFNKAAERRREQKRQEATDLLEIYKGEQSITELYRQRAREQVNINKLRIEGIKAEMDLLTKQRSEIATQAAQVLADLQKLSASGSASASRAAILGGGALETLAGKSYEDLEKLFMTGKLEGKAKELFIILEKLKKEGADIDKLLEENKRRAQETFTGTTADALLDSIAEGFAGGLRSAKDFASKTEDIIRNALLSAFKYQTLQEPLKKLYEELALNAKDGLDSAEIAKFTTDINKTITDAAKIAAEIEKATGVKLSSATSGGTSISGAIKGITEGQADLLAGQFGGLRITSIESLNVARAALRVHENIQINTAQTAARMGELIQRFDGYETGARKLSIK